MPGPKPEFQPQFRPEDIGRCQELVRKREAPYIQVKRAQLALLLVENPAMRSPEAGRRQGWHTNTVLKWRRIWSKEPFRLEDRPRSGRPRKFSPSAGRADQIRRLRSTCSV